MLTDSNLMFYFRLTVLPDHTFFGCCPPVHGCPSVTPRLRYGQLLTFPWKQGTHDLWYKPRNGKWFLIGCYCWTNIPSPLPFPMKKVDVLTPLVGLGIRFVCPGKYDQIQKFHIWTEVCYCGLGPVCLSFTIRRTCSSFLLFLHTGS